MIRSLSMLVISVSVFGFAVWLKTLDAGSSQLFIDEPRREATAAPQPAARPPHWSQPRAAEAPTG